MKIKIEADVTAEEMRKLMGLPDVEAFHEDMMERIRERMGAGAEGYDPLSLFQPYLAKSFSSMEGFQRLMGEMLKGYQPKTDRKG